MNRGADLARSGRQASKKYSDPLFPIGSISFYEENTRLVKTYAKGLWLEAPKEYLELSSS